MPKSANPHEIYCTYVDVILDMENLGRDMDNLRSFSTCDCHIRTTNQLQEKTSSVAILTYMKFTMGPSSVTIVVQPCIH